ncbi:MAG TPA: long-chain fatty acid--CoA ligase [Solirubrobacteraceae bacterium]|jgi:long-chain acyl-CoA synthetase|nr:long-chain fatty acid--CoA ligase [Solirubrobacteraceae bacterium]
MTETADGDRVIATTVAALPGSAAERFKDRIAARYKQDGEWRERTYGEAGEAIDELALGLIDLGVELSDRVCILANTRPEWTLASFAISAAGATMVPIYPTNSPRECEWVAGNSGAKVVIVEDASQLQKLDQVRDQLPELEHVVGIDAGVGDQSLDQLRERGRARDRSELSERQEQIEPDDAWTFIYTSGTTGPPKGVVLTHRNGMSVCEAVEKLAFVQQDEATYLYLPLAHVFALITQLASYDQGTTLVYFGGDSKQILAEIAETKPTYLPSVPRIFEKLYAAASQMQAKASPEDQERMRQAVKLGVQVRRRQHNGEPVPDELRTAFEQADEQVFSRVRALFGGQVRQAVSGAAPIAPEILEFFYAAGVPVLEGWGMTESTGVGTVATLDHFKFGTVGRAVPGTEIKIADDGEILMRGPNIFREYWKNPDATADTLIDGWLHTGDLGELDDEGYLKITGRKKDIIITAGGKNLTPANLENDLKQCRFISQAVMYGDRKPYPVALITLDAEEIGPWAKERNLPDRLEALAETDEVREMIQAELDRANSHYAQVEQVKRFKVLDHDLSIDDGELTPTLKVKRNVIYERYGDLFESMYR